MEGTGTLTKGCWQRMREWYVCNRTRHDNQTLKRSDVERLLLFDFHLNSRLQPICVITIRQQPLGGSQSNTPIGRIGNAVAQCLHTVLHTVIAVADASCGPVFPHSMCKWLSGVLPCNG